MFRLLNFWYFSDLAHDKRGKDKGAKNVQVMSSKAKGKDRLTGRARRSVTAKHNGLLAKVIQPSERFST